MLSRVQLLQPHGQKSLTGYSPWDSPGKNTEVGCYFLLQRIFPTQELNLGLLHCKKILYQLSYEGTVFPPWYILASIVVDWASLIAQLVKNLPAMQETQVQFLGWEDPLEKGMATHSSILAWGIPWTEEPCGLQSMGSERVRRD